MNGEKSNITQEKTQIKKPVVCMNICTYFIKQTNIFTFATSNIKLK